MLNVLEKLLIIEVAVLSFQVVMYFGCELLQHNPHNVKKSFDERIPLRPAWVYVYVLWFPLILFFPVMIYFFSEKIYIIYTVAIIADVIISTIAYVIYPTTFERKKPEKGFFGDSLKFIYFFSFKGYNCAPSMHCSMCYIIGYAALACPGLAVSLRVAVIVLVLAIVAATQLTKQHVIIDAVTAIPVAFVSVAAGYIVNSSFTTDVLIGFLGL